MEVEAFEGATECDVEHCYDNGVVMLTTFEGEKHYLCKDHAYILVHDTQKALGLEPTVPRGA